MLPSARYSPGPFLAMAWLTTFVKTASLAILATGADPSRKDHRSDGDRASPHPHRTYRPASGSSSSRRIDALPGSAKGLRAEAVPCPRVRRRKVLEARLPASDGARPAKVTPVDGRDRRVRGCVDSAGESLRVDGIGANCAVPGVLPPGTIGSPLRTQRCALRGRMPTWRLVFIVALVAKGTDHRPATALGTVRGMTGRSGTDGRH